jgi:hypothetical protein
MGVDKTRGCMRFLEILVPRSTFINSDGNLSSEFTRVHGSRCDLAVNASENFNSY